MAVLSGALPPGWWPVKAELEPDELRPDDARQTAVRVAEAARASWRTEDRFLATASDVLLANGRLTRGADLTIGSLGPGASIVTPPADPAVLGALNRASPRADVVCDNEGRGTGKRVTDSARARRHEVKRRYALVRHGSKVAKRRRGFGNSEWDGLGRSGWEHHPAREPSGTRLALASLSAEFVPFVDFLSNRAVRGEIVLLDVLPETRLASRRRLAVRRDGRSRAVEGGAAFRSGETGLHFILAGGYDRCRGRESRSVPRSALARAQDGRSALWSEARIASLDRAAQASLRSWRASRPPGCVADLAGLLALADAVLASAGAAGRGGDRDRADPSPPSAGRASRLDLPGRLPIAGARRPRRIGGIQRGGDGRLLAEQLPQTPLCRGGRHPPPTPSDARGPGDPYPAAPRPLSPARGPGDDEPHYENRRRAAPKRSGIAPGRLRILVTTARATSRETLVPERWHCSGSKWRWEPATAPRLVTALTRIGYHRVPVVTRWRNSACYADRRSLWLRDGHAVSPRVVGTTRSARSGLRFDQVSGAARKGVGDVLPIGVGAVGRKTGRREVGKPVLPPFLPSSRLPVKLSSTSSPPTPSSSRSQPPQRRRSGKGVARGRAPTWTSPGAWEGAMAAREDLFAEPEECAAQC